MQKTEDTKFNKLIKGILAGLTGDQKMDLLNKNMSKQFVVVLEDKELINSMDAFFTNNLNVSETSRNAFMHRNTLLYRIDKISKMTGFNVRNFEDAVVFKMLELIYRDVYKK